MTNTAKPGDVLRFESGGVQWSSPPPITDPPTVDRLRWDLSLLQPAGELFDKYDAVPGQCSLEASEGYVRLLAALDELERRREM